MTRKLFLLSFLCSLIAMFSTQLAMAYISNWKAEQDKMFEQIKLNPGDVIDGKNWEKVADLLPESIVGYVKKGEFVLKIGEFKYNYSEDEAWDKATEKNRGKYSLGERKEIIDNATGKFPKYIYGRAFPDLDRDDPDLGIKIMHNKTVKQGRAGNMYQECATIFIGEGGLERSIYSKVDFEWYWARPDGELPNPNNYKFTDITRLAEPYDLAGTVILTLRPLDGTPDRSGTYVPALRRVRRTSGTTRSDPFFGSDIVMDDSGGWHGQNETMNWKVLGEKVVLVPKAYWQAESPDKLVKQPNGGWKGRPAPGTHQYGCQDPNWKGAPWAQLHQVWIPRKVYLIEGNPLDPYYNYGRQLFYVDKESFMPVYKITSNRAGDHWKTLMIDQFAQWWGDDNKMTIDQQGCFLVIDDKNHHATASPVRGVWKDWDFPFVIMDPNITPANFSFERIATRSK